VHAGPAGAACAWAPLGHIQVGVGRLQAGLNAPHCPAPDGESGGDVSHTQAMGRASHVGLALDEQASVVAGPRARLGAARARRHAPA